MTLHRASRWYQSKLTRPFHEITAAFAPNLRSPYDVDESHGIQRHRYTTPAGGDSGSSRRLCARLHSRLARSRRLGAEPPHSFAVLPTNRATPGSVAFLHPTSLGTANCLYSDHGARDYSSPFDCPRNSESHVQGRARTDSQSTLRCSSRAR